MRLRNPGNKIAKALLPDGTCKRNSAYFTSIYGQLTKSAHPIDAVMSRNRLAFKFGIGAKLGLSIGFGVILLAGMIISEHLSSRFVAGLVATADRQQSILHESITTEVMLQTAQIAGRDVRRGQTTEQVDA